MTQRIALITGGARGLGLASAQQLVADGLTVALADLHLEAAQASAAALPGGGHVGVACDVADERSVQAMFDSVESRLGPVTVLCCFAGILSTMKEPGRLPTTDITVEEWLGVAKVNSLGTFLCVREMLRRRGNRSVENGRIVTVSSSAGQAGGIGAGSAYSASKASVLALTKVVAREVAPLGITVNAIAPGPIDTLMLQQTVSAEQGGKADAQRLGVPVGRVGRAEEIAAAVSYLVSPKAGFVTGATIDVNGGMYMR